MDELYARLAARDVITGLGFAMTLAAVGLTFPILFHARPYLVPAARRRIQLLRVGQAVLFLFVHVAFHALLAHTLELLTGVTPLIAAWVAIGPVLLADLLLLALLHHWLVARLRPLAAPPPAGHEDPLGERPARPFLHGRSRERLLTLGALVFLAAANLPTATFVKVLASEFGAEEHYTELQAWWIPADFQGADGLPDVELNTWFDRSWFLDSHEHMLFAVGLFLLSFLWLSPRRRGTAVLALLLLHLLCVAALSLGYVREGQEPAVARLLGSLLRILLDVTLLGGLASMASRSPARWASVAVIGGAAAALLVAVAHPVTAALVVPDRFEFGLDTFLPAAVLLVLLPLLSRDEATRTSRARIALALILVCTGFLPTWIARPEAIVNGPLPQFFGSMTRLCQAIGWTAVGLAVMGILPPRPAADGSPRAVIDHPWLTARVLLAIPALVLILVLAAGAFLAGRKMRCGSMCETILPEEVTLPESRASCYGAARGRDDLDHAQKGTIRRFCNEGIYSLGTCKDRCSLFVGEDYSFNVGEPRSELWPNYEAP